MSIVTTSTDSRSPGAPPPGSPAERTGAQDPFPVAFNNSLPVDAPRKTLLLMLGLLLLLLAAAEVLARLLGFLPNVLDNNRWWNIQRANVYARGGKQSLVIVGNSRAQSDLVPTLLGRAFPDHHVVSLAISGAPNFEIIRDLCSDPMFRGTILWDMDADLLQPSGQSNTETQYLENYRNEYSKHSTIEKRFNATAEAWLQSRLALLSPELSLQTLAEDKFKLVKPIMQMHFDRSRAIYYRERMTPAVRKRHRAKCIAKRIKNPRLIDPTVFDQTAADLRRLNQALRSRGGNMILIRMPTTNEFWRTDEAEIPRRQDWDRLQALTGVPTIHFLDYAELRAYDSPDTSHLDASDTVPFTKSLALILSRIPGRP